MGNSRLGFKRIQDDYFQSGNELNPVSHVRSHFHLPRVKSTGLSDVHSEVRHEVAARGFALLACLLGALVIG